MKIKEGDIVYAIKTVTGTLGTVKAGDTFEVIRITAQHVIGRGVITTRDNVSQFPVESDASAAIARMKKEIGL